jgi:TfoX N-terminal domain
MPPIPKPAPGSVSRFRAALAAQPAAVERSMFGCPCAFVGGNMTAGLYGDDWFVRLPAAERAGLLAEDGAHPFAPMPGRPMREYVVLPPSIVADDAAIAHWLSRAVTFALTLPPEQAARRSAPTTR